MLRMLWWMTELAAVVAAALWLFRHPGIITAHWNGYDVETSLGVAFIALVAVIVIISTFTRVMNFLVTLPRRWKNLNFKKRRDRGYRALTLGLSAVSAGDTKSASYQAYRMRRFIPDETGLPWLLEAQAARLRGDEAEARGHFEKLLKDKDTAFLGVRGLLQVAIESADLDHALDLARQALAMHPDQAWIIRTVFGLEVQKREWAAALNTLKRAERARAFEDQDLKSNRIALLLQQAEDLQHGGYPVEALKKMREAQRLDPGFMPSAERLAKGYADLQKRRAAVAVIERAWKENPHPDLVPVWNSLAPANKPHDMAARLRWFERLVALNPGHVESQIAAAHAAIKDGLWGEAWQYLSAAEKLRPNARLYRLWAQMEEKTGHAESARRYWEKAADAPGDKMWICSETGTVYERWSPLALPHGALNTIRWEDPRAPYSRSFTTLPRAGNDQILDPVKQISRMLRVSTGRDSDPAALPRREGLKDAPTP